uniref:tubulin-glutamate carboxypeptidase n=1 Tax=Anabas testudineus TaxID=64144 RepID=A0AAQ6IKH3_ANATE
FRQDHLQSLNLFSVSLQNEGDVESTLNILNVLDELLSAGTDRRIQYMISKGGSEALLTALVTFGRSFNPNYTVLLPLLHLLAKVGYRDRRIGLKAEEAGAALLTLNLLKHNVKHDRRAAACLWVIQVFSSSGTITHTLTSVETHTSFTVSLVPLIICHSSLMVSKGYISGLLRLYEDWHSKDTQHVAIAIRQALLCCLHKVTHITAGRQAFISQGGIRLLYQATQTCLLNKCLESLVESSVNLMRKCLPKTSLPLTSDLSAYTFPLPGRPQDAANTEEIDTCVCVSVQDEDLETDLKKLRSRPDPDRPKNLLPHYNFLCPELSHDFQVHTSLCLCYIHHVTQTVANHVISNDSLGERQGTTWTRDRQTNIHTYVQFGEAGVFGETQDSYHSPGQRGDEQDDEEKTEEEFHHSTIIDRLLENHGPCIPHHNPKLYHATATKTKSIQGFSILAFPDFWGHLPPPGNEPMAPRKPNIQRQKVFEDIRRFLNTSDIINQVVFDLEDSSFQSPPDSLRFFSMFECGNLRKAVQVRRHEYDLILNVDANCSQHTQWFYFEVSNMVADVPYRFNVINCEKSNSQFNYGMQLVLYSVREALEGRPHWVRTGTEICYFRNHFCPVQGRKKTTFYTLTFTITFKHNEDVCYLAYHYPYTYSTVKTHLKVLQKSVDPAKIYFRQHVLCGTLAGNSCPLVTITACPASRSWIDMHQLRNRPYIVLTGRVHPGESNASWVMKGTLEFLCSNDPVAQILREAFIFKIIPMLNPDGVINGTNRCDLNGEDLNRQWAKPDPVLSPTIYHTKGFLYYLNSIGRTPLVFCDYHGHSRKKNVFLYGCSVKETLWQSGSSVDTAGLKEDPGYRTLAKALDRIAPAFSFNSCNYLVEKSRSSTARVVVWREIGVLRSYTMESTYNGCDQGIYKVCAYGLIYQKDRTSEHKMKCSELNRNKTAAAQEYSTA